MVIFGVAILLLGVLGILSVKGISDNKEMLSRPYTDALRGAAVIVVLLHHAETGLYKELPAVFTVFVPLGALGTAVFFYLSGYGNHYSLENNKGGALADTKSGQACSFLYYHDASLFGNIVGGEGCSGREGKSGAIRHGCFHAYHTAIYIMVHKDSASGLCDAFFVKKVGERIEGQCRFGRIIGSIYHKHESGGV